MKNRTRTGKIARLSKSIREELNRRLQDGEQGPGLLAWLNALPQVKRLVGSDFAGEPVSDMNLSRWRQGGYRDWEEQQEAMEAVERAAENGAELMAAGKDRLPDQLAAWLLARQLVAFQRLQAEATDAQEGWKRLREFCNDLVRWRRGDLQSRRVALKEAQWKWKQEMETDADSEFEPEEEEEEEQEERINEIYGRPKGWRPDQISQQGNEGNEEGPEPNVDSAPGEEPQMDTDATQMGTAAEESPEERLNRDRSEGQEPERLQPSPGFGLAGAGTLAPPDLAVGHQGRKEEEPQMDTDEAGKVPAGESPEPSTKGKEEEGQGAGREVRGVEPDAAGEPEANIGARSARPSEAPEPVRVFTSDELIIMGREDVPLKSRRKARGMPMNRGQYEE